MTHYHGHALQFVDEISSVGEIIKTIKIMRGTLDAAFGLNKLQILSKKEEASKRLREDTAPGNPGDTASLC